MDNTIAGLFEKGKRLIKEGDTLGALVCFEKILQNKDLLIPVKIEVESYYAYCIAKERGKFQKAMELLTSALHKDPSNTVHYLNLGRVYLLLNNKVEAIKTFREGLTNGTDQDIVQELQKLGIRKRPPIPFLKRSNPINKYLGLILKGLGLR